MAFTLGHHNNPDMASVDGFWWCSTSFATFGVTVHDGLIVREKSAPLSGKFGGQPLDNLLSWLRKDPNFKAKRLRAVGEPVESNGQ